MMVQSFGMLAIPSNAMNLIVSMTFTSFYPWAKQPKSMHMAFIQLLHKCFSSTSFLYLMMVSLVTRCTTPLANSLISIGDEKDNLEFWSDFGTACGSSLTNILPSTEYTAYWEVQAVLRRD